MAQNILPSSLDDYFLSLRDELARKSVEGSDISSLGEELAQEFGEGRNIPSLGEELAQEFGEVREETTPSPRETPVSTVDPDSFLNQAGIAWDNVKGGYLEGIGLIADMIGSEETAREAREKAEEFRLEAQARPQPTISPSITKEVGKITEGEVDSALEHMMGIAESLTATALPSLIPSIGAYAIANRAAPLISWIPLIGKPVAWSMKLAMTLLPGYLQGSGEIYKAAREEGASEEDAKMAAVTGGLGVGLLDRWAAGTFVKAATKHLGKKAVINGLAPKLGKKIAGEVVEEGLKQSSTGVLKKALGAAALTGAVGKEAAKGFAKGAAAEAPTEAAQEVISMAASRMAADKPIGVDTADFWGRTIDAAALGIAGGGPVRGLTQGMAPMVRRQTINKAKDLEEATDKLPDQVIDAENELATMMNEGHTKTLERDVGDPTLADNLFKGVRRSTTFLKKLAGRTPIGANFVNDLGNFFIDTNQEIGANYAQFQDIIRDAKKTFKIPFTQRIPKKVNDAIAKQLRYNERAADENVAQVADRIRTFLDQQHKRLSDAGVDINYVENYLTNAYKIPMTGPLGRRRRAKKKFKRILDRHNVKDSGAVLDNIISNNNVHVTENEIDIFELERPEGTLPVAKRSFEKSRKIPKHVVKELDEAGLVENNVEALVNRYIVGGTRRAKTQEIKNRYQDNQKDMDFREGEREYASKIFQALQNRYKAFDKKGKIGKFARPVWQWANTAGYVTTLPLAGITALTEPLIVLSRVSPRHAIWAAKDAALVSAAKTARTFFPKMKPGKLEQSMMNLMQTADLALVDSIRDIGDMAIHKKITDKFFRANMLAQVTQASRYMAFSAAKRQIQEDIKILEQEGDIGRTRESQDARSRLKKQGLANVVKGLEGHPIPNIKEIVDWAESPLHGERAVAEPPLITKAIGKTVDEIIMTPNVVNRPLWMSNPWLSPFAQLKGFMMVFGNTIAPKLWHEVGRPLWKGRMPVGEAAKWTMTLSLLMAAMYGTQMLQDAIKYGDEDSPRDDMEGDELLFHLLKRSNIMGYGNLIPDAIKSQEWGIPFPLGMAGPVPVKLMQFFEALGGLPEGNPTRIANWISKNTPIVGMFSYDTPIREEWREYWEDMLD